MCIPYRCNHVTLLANSFLLRNINTNKQFAKAFVFEWRSTSVLWYIGMYTLHLLNISNNYWKSYKEFEFENLVCKAGQGRALKCVFWFPLRLFSVQAFFAFRYFIRFSAKLAHYTRILPSKNHNYPLREECGQVRTKIRYIDIYGYMLLRFNLYYIFRPSVHLVVYTRLP